MHCWPGLKKECQKISFYGIFPHCPQHLWYLQALVYVLVIAFIVEHLGLRKLAYLAVPVLLAGNLIKGNYSLLLLGKDYCHVYYARNFLYCGLPFFWLGCLFGERKEALEGCLDKRK